MARDAEFPKAVTDLAAERAGHKCSVPTCYKGTIGPGATGNKSAQKGTACHIYSASSGGPRGTGGLSKEERQSIENAIWCCADHGRLIDTNKGDRYPAELLKQWKRLHEARVDREVSGLKTHLGWVHRLEIINSILFRPSVELQFSKATFIYGDGAVGKSSICEWLAGISLPRALMRWRKYDHDIELEYFSPDPQTILLSMNEKGVHRSLNGKPLLEGPADLRVIYLPGDYDQKFRRDLETDDLNWLAKIFSSDPETIKNLYADIRINGHHFCRYMEFREEHWEENEEEGESARDGWYLYVATDRDPSAKLPLESLATSEQIEVMVQLATALARVQALHTPTLLVLDAGSWNWCDELFDEFAPYLAEQPYQVVLARAVRPTHFSNKEWVEWSAAEVKRGKGRGNNTIVPAFR
jgi:hypothetical protein